MAKCHPGFNALVAKGEGHGGGGSGIHIKPSHKGELHAELGVPQGQKIPASKLAAAKNSSNPAERKRAVFAQNAKKWGGK